MGLDSVSPRGHVISNTIDEAGIYHSKSKSLLDSRAIHIYKEQAYRIENR
jgi:hypothetical protein